MESGALKKLRKDTLSTFGYWATASFQNFEFSLESWCPHSDRSVMTAGSAINIVDIGYLPNSVADTVALMFYRDMIVPAMAERGGQEFDFESLNKWGAVRDQVSRYLYPAMNSILLVCK